MTRWENKKTNDMASCINNIAVSNMNAVTILVRSSNSA